MCVVRSRASVSRTSVSTAVTGTAPAPVVVPRETQPNAALIEALGSELAARVIAGRGIASAAELDYALDGLLPADRLGGTAAAAVLLARAIEQDWAITIVGDYDADGATSTALAVVGLRECGARDVRYLVPDRVRDGYGLSTGLAERVADGGARLLVTVDNGIGSAAGVARARELGLEVLVTDHHLPSTTLPPATVIVNPNLPDEAFPSKCLAGVGVMFYVLLALRAHLRVLGRFAGTGPNFADLLDLVALGTVADVVPLDRNNRLLVHQGLRRIRAGRARPGVRALLRAARRDAAHLVERDVGFGVAPRLNAAGRLADMTTGVRCLLATTDAEADALAAELDAINRERRALTERMTRQAHALLDEAAVTADHAVCLYREDWHEGVVGIVAGRVRELVDAPAFAFAPGLDALTGQPVLKGSGRSVPEVNLRDVLVDIDREHPGLLLRFGGHAMAAGATLTPARLRPFSQALRARVAALRGERSGVLEIPTDGPLADSELVLATARRLRELGPFGSGFPEPTFHGEFAVVSVRRLASDFHRLVLRAEQRLVAAVVSGSAPAVGARHTFVYGLDIDRFRGDETLQLRIERWW